MSSGKNPLMWMMALTMPGAAQAIGLGDIHVDSALNERLAAEIDIVGATALELADLKAAIANRETFARFGADRPAFVASTTFKVTQDSQGRPVLSLRSTESFTEPVVNILVDLNWRSGQLVRQYTLLLDPAGFSVAPTPAAVAAPVVATTSIAAAPVAATPAAATPDLPAATGRKTTHLKVGANATLRGIAWRVGERSESDLQRMMLAIFRANPSAFDGNINRLHRGAVLTIPSRAEAAAIPKIEAKREIHAQMTAWRSPGLAAKANRAAPIATVAAAPVTAAPVAAAAVAVTPAVAAPVAAVPVNAPTVAPTPATGDNTETLAAEKLDRRVQSLEKELNEVQALLSSEREQLFALQRQAAREDKPAAAAPAPVNVDAPHVTAKPTYGVLIPAIAGLGALTAALALFFRRRRGVPPNVAPNQAMSGDATGDRGTGAGVLIAHAGAPSAVVAAEAPSTPALPEAETQVAADEATQPALPVLPEVKPAGHSDAAHDTTVEAAHDTTVNLLAKTVNLRMDTTRLDYNFLDLDLTAQHVQMPSVLNETAVVKERRTNLADVLKMAIEREPDRQDLRMKLLELYYSAAATNRTAFLEVVQKLARDRDLLQDEQWDKIAFMGRQIAGENPMFAESDDEDLADCA
jgi:pilus assembly protein FimV